jgi:hypothetical protein
MSISFSSFYHSQLFIQNFWTAELDDFKINLILIKIFFYFHRRQQLVFRVRYDSGVRGRDYNRRLSHLLGHEKVRLKKRIITTLN